MVLTYDTDYFDYKNLPYLINKSDYITDLSQATDIEYSSLYEDISSMNQISNDYLSDRGSLTPSSNVIMGSDPLDTSIINSYLSNNAMIKEKSENEAQYMKSVSNRLKNLKNRSNNNELVHEILNGNSIDGIQSSGELDIANSQIEIMKEDVEMRDRQIKISEYYTKKRQDQISFFQNASLILIVLFVFGLLFKFGYLSETIFTIIIGCGLAVLVIYIIYKSLDMIFRDKTNYNEYQMFINPVYYLNLNDNGTDSNSPGYTQPDDTSSDCS